ncbi:MAG: tetratricopeptide repeat protein [Actinomycetota bacterium]
MPEETYELFESARRLMEQGHNHQAATILTRACEQEPEKASLSETLAQALYRSGQVRRAAQEFERTIQLDPANHYAHFGLALCEAKLGLRQMALGHLKLAIAMSPSSTDYQQALQRFEP